MSDVNNLPLPIGSSIVSNLIRSVNKGVRGERAKPNMYINTAFLFFSHKLTQFYFAIVFRLPMCPADAGGGTSFTTPRLRCPLCAVCFYIVSHLPSRSPGTSAAESLSFCACPWSSCTLLKLLSPSPPLILVVSLVVWFY